MIVTPDSVSMVEETKYHSIHSIAQRDGNVSGEFRGKFGELNPINAPIFGAFKLEIFQLPVRHYSIKIISDGQRMSGGEVGVN